MANPKTSLPRQSDKQLPWKWIIAGLLGLIITVSVVYIAVATWQSQHALPAYFSQMSGAYGITKDGKDLGSSRTLELHEDGTYAIHIELMSNGKWGFNVGGFGKWYVRENILVLDGTGGAGVQTELQIKEGGFYSPSYGLSFIKH